MIKKKIVLLFVVLFVSLASYAQQKVTGTVVDENGDPVIGATVMVKGTTQGATITDLDGSFKITCMKDATLVISSIGLQTQEVSVEGKNHVDVKLLLGDEAIDEVVVTALGVSREKKALGYAVTEVGGDKLSTVKPVNLVNSLSGRVAGVNITQATSGLGGGTMVILRGNNSLTGNNQPLYVVDGVSIDNSGFGGAAGSSTDEYSKVDYGTGISDINPDDIESITVLKGPNAAALYGSRAANGVILITTKSGKNSKGLGVTYSLQTTFEEAMLLPKYQNQYGQGSSGLTYTQLEELVKNGGSWGAKFDGQNHLAWTGEELPYVAQKNNVGNFFQTGVNLVNTVAIESGNDNSSFRFSYTNNDHKGMIPNSKLTKNNFNIRANTKINNLSVDAKVTYFTQKVKNRIGQGTEGLLAYLYYVPRNLRLVDYENYQDPETYGVRTYTNGSTGNPYWGLNHDVNEDTRNRLQGFVKATYQFTDWLSAFIRVGTDRVTHSMESVSQYGHWFKAKGAFNYKTITLTESNADFLLMFNKKLGEDFSLSANFGGNMLYQTYTSQSVYGEDFKIPTKPTTSSAKILKPYYTPLREKRINSLYGTASLSYRDMIYLDLSARNDWSSTLPADNRSYFYPSVSLSLLLNEMFQPLGNIFDLAKLRTSWAQVGADTEPYQLTLTYNLQQEGYLGLTTLTRPSVKLNPDLKPEKTNSFEVGFEFSMFNNRVYGDFSYYKIETKDLIMDVPVPKSTGYNKFRENIGLMINEGAEFMVGGTPVKTQDLQWDISLNFAKNNNRLVELVKELENLPFSTINSGSVRAQATVGGGFGDIYGKTYMRDPQGRIVVDDNGIPRATQDLVKLGNWQPDWTAGITNTVRYKGVSLSFLIDATYGGQLYSGTDAGLDGSGVSDRTLQYRDGGYTYENAVKNVGTEDEPNYEAFTKSITGSEYWTSLMPSDYVYDKTNIRLRELSLSYRLPKNVVQSILFKDITVSLIGRNLFFIYKKMDNFDPESSMSTNQFAQGFLFNSVPTARSIGFNLNIKF